MYDPGLSRYNLEVTNDQWVWGYPDNETAYASSAAPNPNSLFDGQWHRIRLAVAVSSASNVPDGMARLWIDNTLRSDLRNVVINRGGLTDFAIGQTRNQGAGALMSIWWGKATLYANDPGW